MTSLGDRSSRQPVLSGEIYRIALHDIREAIESLDVETLRDVVLHLCAATACVSDIPARSVLEGALRRATAPRALIESLPQE